MFKIYLKQVIQERDQRNSLNLVMEEDILKEQLEKCLSININVYANKMNLNTTQVGVPKYLHWFEWEKKNLNLFNVVTYTHKVVKLIVPFKIPVFSRSVMIPDGRIYLMGGEDQDGAKKQVYCIDVKTIDENSSFSMLNSMPCKKIDFSMTYLDNHIYIITGKDHSNEIVGTCEAYNIQTDRWKLIADVNQKRYAASAISIQESKKIFLFGGRSDNQSTMAKYIEEYSVELNIWRKIKLKKPNDWTPAEVCNGI